jgi:N-acetylglucosaminyl-diphospho-decaprenol L-rhamnosyltransferase
VPCPEVTVVVVTWNGAHLLGPCLDALLASTLPRDRFEVLVVDNASVDGTPELVAATWPEVRVQVNDRNLGFAGGCASALPSVTSRWAVLINNDAVVAADALERLVEAARDRPECAGLTARVLLADRFREVPAGTPGAVVLADGRSAAPLGDGDDTTGSLDVLNSTGGEVDREGRGRDRGWLAVDDGRDHPADVFAFCGAAALLDTAAVRQARGFDARYFLYYEDTDLSWRLRLLGWQLGHVPGAVVRHQHAASSGEGSALHRFHDDRNRLLTLVKCAPAGTAWRLVLRHLLTVASVTRREAPRWPTAGTRLRALASFLRLLPHALAERRAVGRLAVVPRRQVAALMVAPESASSRLRQRGRAPS